MGTPRTDERAILLHTLWKIWDDDNVELLFALDEYTVEGNFKVWEAGVREACARYKITEADTREAVIRVNVAPIEAAFREVQTTGEVVADA